MSATKHTAEPWRIGQTQAGRFPTIPIYGKDGTKVADFGIFAEQSRNENAARIVACVNACAGVEDPAAAIASAKRALERAIRCASPEWDVHEIADYKNALRALGGQP